MPDEKAVKEVVLSQADATILLDFMGALMIDGLLGYNPGPNQLHIMEATSPIAVGETIKALHKQLPSYGTLLEPVA